MEEQKQTILIVEDDPVNRGILVKLLERKYNIVEAEHGEEAFERLRRNRAIDLIMLDLFMPVMNGIEFLEKKKDTIEYAKIPVIVTTQETDPDVEAKALDLGADDFVVKPYNTKILEKRVGNLINKYVLEKRRIEDELKRTMMELQYRSRWDVLTGLYNRSTFYEEAEKLIKDEQNKGKQYIIAVYDIDNFKVINELFGNHVGDEVLRNFAEILRTFIKDKEGICGRLEADHFATCTTQDNYAEYKDVMNEYMTRGLQGNVIDYPVYAHIGLYDVKDKNELVGTMCDRAKLAIQMIKANAITRYSYYNADMSKQMYLEQQLVNDFDAAIRDKQFYIQLQPIVDTVTGDVISAEALVRWNHPEKGFISPGDFVPIFEKNGYITELDYYVWEAVCSFLEYNIEHDIENVPVSINVSRKNFLKGNIEEKLTHLLEKHHVPINLLKLEVTESAYMDSADIMIETIHKLQQKGFLILMDDFGSGFSSLNMLKDVPADILKLDMVFLSEIENSDRGSHILYSVVDMTKHIHMQTVAEGVETKNQYMMLRRMGCDSIQGYYFSKPLLPEDFREYVKEHRSSDFLEQELMKDKKNILVVDDDSLVRIVSGRALSDYNVITAENGAEALEILEKYKKNISFVMTDIVMPVMGGFELIQAMKENTNLKEIPIMVLTAEGTSKMALSALSAGAIDLINKPVEPNVLRARVRNILEKGSYIM